MQLERQENGEETACPVASKSSICHSQKAEKLKEIKQNNKKNNII
jgi:hypothetical protein